MISIIIPIYNTEQYLGQCLDSILCSANSDCEIILVDDGSVDQSLRICREYNQKDGRVKVIAQQHKGVSEARNKGIEASGGEWIVFIDSDDTVSKDFFRIISRTEYSDQDLLIFDYHKLDEEFTENDVFNRKAVSLQYGIEDRGLLIEKLLNADQLAEGGNTSLLPVWGKAYKKDIIEKYSIRFPADIVIGEDRIFNIEYLLRIKSCMYISKAVYFIRVRSDSVMHGFCSEYLQNDRKYQERLVTVLKHYHFFSKIMVSYYNSVLSSMADVLVRGIFSPKSSRGYMDNCKLCQEMQKYEIYRKALKYNNRTGVIARRILLFFFQKKCYCIVRLICKFCYIVLEKIDRL